MAAKKKKTALSHYDEELQHQLHDAPEEIGHESDVKKQKYIAKEREGAYEEENFMRLPVTKTAERLAKKSVHCEQHWGQPPALVTVTLTGLGAGKKKEGGMMVDKGGKSKKKFKIKKKKFK